MAKGFLSKLFGGGTASGQEAPKRPGTKRSAPPKAGESAAADPPEHWWETLSEEEPEEREGPAELPVDPDLLYARLAQKIEDNTLTMIEIPANILRIINIMNDPDFQYGSVAGLVSQSPVLAADFLRVANSAVYSRGTPINDIRIALPRLGLTTVQGMLYMHATRMKLANNPLFKDLATAIVDHSLAVAIISKYLSLRFYADPDQAFMAGLLHDIGRLAVLQELSQSKLLPAGLEGPLPPAVFERAFTFAPHVGALIAEYWNLEEEITFSIAHHEAPPEPSGDAEEDLRISLSCLTNLSVTLARMLGRGKSIGPVDLFALPVCEKLGIDGDDRDTVRFFDQLPGVLANQQPG